MAKVSIQTNPLSTIGSFLSSFQGSQDAQQDRSYLASSRAQQLQSMQLGNDSKSMQNTAAQRALDDQTSVRDAAVEAMRGQQTTDQGQQSSPFQDKGGASQDTGTAVANAQPVKPQADTSPAKSPAAQKGPLALSDYAALDAKNGLPPGTSYATAKVESNFDPNALNKKSGATGMFQVLPSTAAQPGFGLQAFDPKDPGGAMSYMGMLAKKAGGDPAKMAAMYNAGPNGKFDNPETQAYVPKFQAAMQEFQVAQNAQQQSVTPSPADHVAAAESTGAPVPLKTMQSAVGAQQRMVQQALGTAQALEKAGKPDLAQPYYQQAAKLQAQGAELQSKALTQTTAANKEVASLAANVTGQDSYDNLISQVQDNPAMQSAVKGLNLTGDYEQDKDKLATLAHRTETLKDQQDVQLKQQRLELDRQKEVREQQKADAPKQAAAAAQAQDDKRLDHAKDLGVPFVPSIASQGGDPKMVAQAQQEVNKANAKILPTIDQHTLAARAIADATTQMGALLTKPNPVETSGFLGGMFGAASKAITPDQQLFDKVSGQLVTAMQAEAGAQGGSRSSFTAAMYKNYENQKPTLNKADPVNLRLVQSLWIGAQDTQQRGKFLREFHDANPNADVQQGAAMWESYEQSLGPAFVVDPRDPFGSHPNMNRSPITPDGKPNSSYVDYKDYFKANYHG